MISSCYHTHWHEVHNPALSPFLATHPKNASITPLFATHFQKEMYPDIPFPKLELPILPRSAVPQSALPTPNAPASSRPTANTSPSSAYSRALGSARISPAIPPLPGAIPHALSSQKSVATPPKSPQSNRPPAQTLKYPAPARTPPRISRHSQALGK